MVCVTAAPAELRIPSNKLAQYATSGWTRSRRHPPGTPFLKAFRLLAGDGAGTLLWYCRRRHQLLLSTPDDLDLRALEPSLDRLQAGAAQSPPPARRAAVRRPAEPRPAEPRPAEGRAAERRGAAPRRVARHLVNTAEFHHLTAGERQLLLDALAGELPDPSRAYAKVHTRAELVLGQAAVTAPEDPVLGVAVRARAQVTTGELRWWRARRAGSESVEVPLGDRAQEVVGLTAELAPAGGLGSARPARHVPAGRGRRPADHAGVSVPPASPGRLPARSPDRRLVPAAGGYSRVGHRRVCILHG